MQEQVFANEPTAILNTYVTNPDYNPPSPGDLQLARDTIKGSFGKRDALGICIDLGRKLDYDTTDTLAAMFHQNDPSLPANWRENPEIMRTVLSMSASLDMGLLFAMKFHQAHDGGSSQTDFHITRLSDFLGKLQQQTGEGLGETPTGLLK